MAMSDYQIVGSYNNQREQGISPERTVNMFEYIDPRAKRSRVLVPTSGMVYQELTFDSVVATAPVRAQFVFNSANFVVMGAKVYRMVYVGTTLSITNIGTLNTSTGRVAITANSFQVIFVDGLDGWIWDATLGFREIKDTSFPTAPIDVTYLDGFFIIANGSSNNFFLSKYNEGLTWGVLSDTNLSMAASSTNIVLGSITNAAMQIGMPVTFTAGSGAPALPSEIKVDTTYYVASLVSTNAFTVSATLGGAAIESTAGCPDFDFSNNGELQQGSITAHPGNIVACRTLHRRLFLFSENYTEVWENQGLGTNLPLRRNNSLLIEYGTPSAASIATGFDIMIFLSQDQGGLGAIMEVAGTQATPISPQSLDYQLAQYAADGNISDASAFLVKENGLIFYRLNFTNANHTFVYNVTQSTRESLLWHEEETLSGNRHAGENHAYFNGINYIGAYNEPKLYVLDPNWYLNGTEKIRRMRIGAPIMPPGQVRVRADRFQLDLLQGSKNSIIETLSDINIIDESGLPILGEAGNNIVDENEELVKSEEDLSVFLSISKDSGQSYGYRNRAAMGKVGDRTYLTTWRKLGVIPKGQAFVPKIEFYNNGQFLILGAAWNYEVLPD